MRNLIKWTVRGARGILVLVVLLILALQTGTVKRLIKNKLESYLSDKTKSTVQIAAVNYSLPKWVELDGVF